MDDLPKGFYNQPKQANLPRDKLKNPPPNIVPKNADPNLPENFYKYQPKGITPSLSDNRSAHEQLGINQTSSSNKNYNSSTAISNGTSNNTNTTTTTNKPDTFDTFEIERRLRLLSSTKKEKPVKTADLAARLEKLRGHDVPPPSISDIQTRLKNLSGVTASDFDKEEEASSSISNDLSVSPKKRKVAPLITVMSISDNTNPEDLITQVQKELGLDPIKEQEKYELQIKAQTAINNSKPVADMTPEELLALVTNEKFDQPDSERSEGSLSDYDSEKDKDLFSDDDSDGTHDSISSELITDDEGDGNDKSLSRKNKISRKEWKQVIRQVLKEEKEKLKAEGNK